VNRSPCANAFNIGYGNRACTRLLVFPCGQRLLLSFTANSGTLPMAPCRRVCGGKLYLLKGPPGSRFRMIPALYSPLTHCGRRWGACSLLAPFPQWQEPPTSSGPFKGRVLLSTATGSQP